MVSVATSWIIRISYWNHVGAASKSAITSVSQFITPRFGPPRLPANTLSTRVSGTDSSRSSHVPEATGPRLNPLRAPLTQGLGRCVPSGCPRPAASASSIRHANRLVRSQAIAQPSLKWWQLG
jgi:hypothetical protein